MTLQIVIVAKNNIIIYGGTQKNHEKHQSGEPVSRHARKLPHIAKYFSINEHTRRKTEHSNEKERDNGILPSWVEVNHWLSHKYS